MRHISVESMSYSTLVDGWGQFTLLWTCYSPVPNFTTARNIATTFLSHSYGVDLVDASCHHDGAVVYPSGMGIQIKTSICVGPGSPCRELSSLTIYGRYIA